MRRGEERDKKKQGKRKLAAIKAQIRSMIRENKAYGDEGLYAGFRFEAIDEDEIDEEEWPYLGAIVPLDVAAKYPEILLKDTLDLEEILCDDKVPVGTKKIVGPGQYTIIGAWFPNSVYSIPKPALREDPQTFPVGTKHPSRKRDRDEEEDERDESSKPDDHHPPSSPPEKKKPKPWQVLIGCLIMIAGVASLLCCCLMVLGLVRR